MTDGFRPEENQVIDAMLKPLDASQAPRSQCARAGLLVRERYANPSVLSPDVFSANMKSLSGAMEGFFVGVLMEDTTDGSHWRRQAPGYGKRYMALKTELVDTLEALGIETNIAGKMISAMEIQWLEHYDFGQERLAEGQRRLSAAQNALPQAAQHQR